MSLFYKSIFLRSCKQYDDGNRSLVARTNITVKITRKTKILLMLLLSMMITNGHMKMKRIWRHLWCYSCLQRLQENKGTADVTSTYEDDKKEDHLWRMWFDICTKKFVKKYWCWYITKSLFKCEECGINFKLK